MADTFFERVTGKAADAAEPIAVNLVLTDETLLGGDDTPAEVSGYGPIPASVARGLVHKAVTDKRSRCTLRRLYRHPKSGQSVAMESRSRVFWLYTKTCGPSAVLGVMDVSSPRAA